MSQYIDQDLRHFDDFGPDSMPDLSINQAHQLRRAHESGWIASKLIDLYRALTLEGIPVSPITMEALLRASSLLSDVAADAAFLHAVELNQERHVERKADALLKAVRSSQGEAA